MKAVLCAMALSLVTGLARPAAETAVPLGKSAEIDGKMPAEEWADAAEIKVGKEGSLRIKHDKSTLFLSHSKLPPEGFACLFVKTGNDARVLHASAQLGSARYLKKDEAWNPQSKDYAWKKADAMWKDEGWKASTGAPAGQEFAVSFKTLGIEGDAAATIAFGYVHFEGREGKAIVWPETGDSCGHAKLLAGWNPEGMKFDFSKWAVIRPSAK